MEIITATALSSQQKELVQELFRACREFEGMTLTFPAEDGDFFVLCMENGTLASALALYYLEPHLYECTAATRPDMRKQGYFSKALAQAELHFPNSDFSFVTDGHCPASAFVLKKLNARFWYNEHMMTLELSQWQPPVCALPPSFSMTVDENGKFTAFAQDREIGVCFITPLGGGVYFYGMEIRAPFRGKGYGKAFFLQVLKSLQENTSTVTLQVSGNNTVALNLYKKTGFRITETLSYYLY